MATPPPLPSPTPSPPKPRHRVATLDHLRQLIGENPGKQLCIEIEPTISFDDVWTMWEAASLTGGQADVFNPEMLRSKTQASEFVGARIKKLETWLDQLNGHIGCMRNWCLLMQKNLDNRGPYIPESHMATAMFGPSLYLDLDKIGTVNDVGQHRKDILREYFGMKGTKIGMQGSGSKRKRSDSRSDGEGVLDFSRSREREGFFSPREARWRETHDRYSLIKINMDFLQIKIEGLTLLRDRLRIGIRAMKRLSKERMYMGCGNGDFSSFRNIPMGPTAMDVD